jgi:hypothetical protein
MRISADPRDPGHVADAADWLVLFDGVPQDGTTGRIIVTADEATGLIVYERRGPDGMLEIEWIGGEQCFKRFEERGKVFIMRRLDKGAPGLEPVMPPCDTEKADEDEPEGFMFG